MKVDRLLLCLVGLLSVVVLVRCGGGSSSSSTNNGSQLSVSTTSSQLSPGVVSAAYPATILAAIGGTAPYTWSISSGALPAGLTLNPGSGAISGTPTASGTANFTAKVTDSSIPQRSATANLSITVNPAALTIATSSLPSGNVGTAYSTTLAASGGSQPYSWSITSGNLPTGLNIAASTGTISGTPTASGTFNFTATATDSQSPTAHTSASLSIVINSAASCTNNSNLNASYAMLLQGWTVSSTGEVFYGAAASFVADGAGNISSGLLDSNDVTNGPQSGSFTGTYCVASNNLGTMTLSSTSLGNVALAFSLESNGNGHVIVYDTGNVQAAGIFLKQNVAAFSAASINGNYSMSMLGVNPTTGSRLGFAGAFTANGSANLTSGDVDINQQGTLTNTTFSSSNLTVAVTGRGTVGLAVAGVGTLNYTFYVVSASQILLVSNDSSSTALLTGQMTKQSGLTGTNADLNGVTVLSTQGLHSGTTPGVDIALLTADGAGSFTASGTQNHGGTITAFSPTSGSYSVAANGRVTIASGGNTIAIAYLTGKNNAIVLDTSSAVGSGALVPQAAGSFSNSSISNNYYGGSRQPVLSSVDEEIDQLNAASGTLNVAAETSSTQNNGSGSPASANFSGSYSIAPDGTGTVSQGGNQVAVIYIVTSSNFLLLDTTTSSPKVVGYQH